ncbi:MAG: N-acetylmuramoyl-L-alanine amidase [Terriglobales bacterium]
MALTLAVVALLSLALTALISAAAVPAASPALEKQLSVYAPVATYTLPVLERSGHEYVGLLELLEPLGRVTSQTSGQRWNIRYNAVDGDFAAGKTRAKIRGRNLDLPAPFLIENLRGFVPLASLGVLLPRFLGAPVDFHQSGRRLFVGNVAIQPSFQIETSPQSRLLLNFTAPVNPTISTEPGRVRLVFKRDPVMNPGSQSISFDDKVITQAIFSESNGLAEIDVTAGTPLLATFSNGGKTITLAAAPGSATIASSAASSAPGTGTPPQGKTAAGTPQPAVLRPLIFVDPAHGGDERGAALTDSLAEKDVTLGFARLLRHELELRGFAAVLSREGDSSVSLDQRAGAANTAQAVLFIGLHATSQGDGARVYIDLLPREGASKGVFRAWNSAQAPALAVSGLVATAIVNELQVKKMSARSSPASLRPLNNVLMPAVAVELAPGPNGTADLSSATYQQQAAAAIADAVVTIRDRLGVQP